MPKKQMIDSKGNTWEWEETPEVVKAVQRLHNDYRELHDKEERAKIKQEDDKKGYDTYSKKFSFHSFFIMKYQLDEYDLKMIRTALCYFDMYEDGSYDKWFGKDHDKMNESFDYLYEITS